MLNLSKANFYVICMTIKVRQSVNFSNDIFEKNVKTLEIYRSCRSRSANESREIFLDNNYNNFEIVFHELRYFYKFFEILY